MADTSNLSKFLGDIADAIRTKKETTETIAAKDFDTEILGIETGIDAEVTTFDYGLNMRDVDIPVAGGGIHDVSPDGKLFAVASNKTITVYTLEDGKLTQILSNTFNVAYNFTSCRFGNAYQVTDGAIVNIYAASCGHDSDYFQVGIMRVKKVGERYEYASIVSSNLATSWEGNYTNIYPHPTYPNIVMVIAAGRQASRGTHIRLLQVVSTTVTKVYSVDQPSAYNSDFSNCYDYTWGQWGDDNNFYLQDTTLALTYKVAVDITDGVANSASISTFTNYMNGYKTFSKNYCLINRRLYTIDGTKLKDFSSQYIQNINLLFENEDGLFIYTTQTPQATLYYVNINNNYELIPIRSYKSSGVINPFNNTGTHRIFDKVRITCLVSNPGKILTVAGEIVREPISMDYDGITYYNTNDTTATPSDVLVGRVYRNFNGKITGTMPTYSKTYTPGDDAISINNGCHNGSKIAAVDITTLSEYKECVDISNNILGNEV